MSRTQKTVIVLAAFVALVLGLTVNKVLNSKGDGTDKVAMLDAGIVLLPQSRSLPGLALTDQDGQAVQLDQLKDKWSLLFFGYTFCPDICPTDLLRNALAADELAENGVDVGQVFVTIDPDRDTPEVVKEFSQSIHPDLIGLTGTPEQIAVVARDYKVYYRKAGEDPEDYLMDHSTFTYLMAPGGEFLEFYGSDVSPEAVADSVSCFAGRS